MIEKNTIPMRPKDTSCFSNLITHLTSKGIESLLNTHNKSKKTPVATLTKHHPEDPESQIKLYEGCHIVAFLKFHFTQSQTIENDLAGNSSSKEREAVDGGARKNDLEDRFLSLHPMSGRETFLRGITYPPRNSISVGRAKTVFSLMEQFFETSKFQVLLSFYWYCYDKHLPLRVFDGDRLILKAAIDDMEKYKKGYRGEQKDSSVLARLIDTPRYLDVPITKKQNNNGKQIHKVEEISLSPLNHSDIPFLGREDEIAKLDEFIDDPAPFQMLYMIAPSGAGKTRLITQWHRNNQNITGWQSGFIDKEQTPDAWDQWIKEPLGCDTLIIVDYIYRFKQIIKLITDKGVLHAQENIVKDSARYRVDAPKLRLIMLDHVMPENSRYDELDSHKRHATGRYTQNYSHPNSPLFLGKTNPESHEKMIRGIIGHVSGYALDSHQVNMAYDTLLRMDNIGDREKNHGEVKFANYPLFAILIGKKLATLDGNTDFEQLTHWQRRDLIDFYFDDQNHRRIPWKDNKEFGVWVGAAISASTVLQSLPYQLVFDVLNHPDIRTLISETIEADEKSIYCLPKRQEQKNSLKATCNHIVSSMEEDSLLRFQPDILGETFTLRFVADFEDDFKHHAGGAIPLFKMLCTHDERIEINSFIHKGMLEFVIRTARNLCHDDPNIYSVKQSWAMLLLLLQPDHYAESNRMRISVFVAITSVVKLVNQYYSERLAVLDEHLQSLIDLVDIEFLLDGYCHYTNIAKESIGSELSIQWIEAIMTYIDWCLYKSTLSKDLIDKLEKCFLIYESHSAVGRKRIFLFGTVYAPRLLNWVTQSLNLNINAQDNAGGTPLMMAAYVGRQAALQQLLAVENIEINTHAKDGFTALIYASQNGHADVVKQLLDADGIEVDAIDNLGFTALMVASQNDHADVVEQLRALKKADLNIKNQQGVTALMLAAGFGYEKVVSQLLCGDNVEVNIQNRQGLTALMLASQDGHLETVRQLLNFDRTDVNLRNNDGFTALMLATHFGHKQVVELLLDVDDINVDARDKQGAPAFMLAVKNGSKEIMTNFLEREEIDVNTQDDRGFTALMHATQNGYTDIVTHLLDVDTTKVNIQNESGVTSLMIAAHHGQTETLSILLDHDGVDVNIKEKSGFTALMVACQNGNSVIAGHLLRADDVDVNARARKDFTALMLACQDGHQEVVAQLLLVDEIDVNAKAAKGYTALMIACLNGHEGVVSQLLSVNEVDLNCKTSGGKSAYHIAWSRDYKNIMYMLLADGRYNINQTIEDETQLMLACKNGQIDLVNACLKNPEININQVRPSDKLSALMIACQSNQLSIVGLLLTMNHLDINAVNKDGRTALMIACANANVAIVKRILREKGVDTRLKDKNGTTALSLTEGPNTMDITKCLLEYNAFSFSKWLKKILYLMRIIKATR